MLGDGLVIGLVLEHKDHGQRGADSNTERCRQKGLAADLHVDQDQGDCQRDQSDPAVGKILHILNRGGVKCYEVLIVGSGSLEEDRHDCESGEHGDDRHDRTGNSRCHQIGTKAVGHDRVDGLCGAGAPAGGCAAAGDDDAGNDLSGQIRLTEDLQSDREHGEGQHETGDAAPGHDDDREQDRVGCEGLAEKADEKTGDRLRAVGGLIGLAHKSAGREDHEVAADESGEAADEAGKDRFLKADAAEDRHNGGTRDGGDEN